MKNIILDLDTGIDDSMALALAVIDKNINLLGVTTTFGNVTTKVSCVNSRYMLDLFGAKDIPVIKGLDNALDKTSFERDFISAKIHGDNGLGNLPIDLPSYKKENYLEFTNFVLSMIEKYGKDLTIVTTGPLTNVAFLLQNYPSQMKKISEIVSMGGAIINPGNMNTYEEANINKDPLAAKIVMESSVHNVIVPLDVTEKVRINLDETKKWEDCNCNSASTLSKMVNYYIAQHPNKRECFIHDPSAVMYCINPEYFTLLSKHMTVLIGEECRGRVIADSDKIREKDPTTTLCLDVKEQEVSDYINNCYISFFKKNK